MDHLTLISSSAITRRENDCPFPFCQRGNMLMGYSRIKSLCNFLLLLFRMCPALSGSMGLRWVSVGT